MYRSRRKTVMDQLEISVGSKVLLLWGASNSPEAVKDAVNQLTHKVGADGKVQVEHMERLQLCKLKESTPLNVNTGKVKTAPYSTTSPGS